LIRIAGEEARTFLQGQVTNDVREVTPAHSQMSSLCSPKGRMLANFRVFQREEALFLQLPSERLEGVIKRLRLYVLRAKVEISDASDALVRVGITGQCAAQLLPMVPDAPADSTISHASLTIIRHPGETPRFEVIGPAETMREFWAQCARVATPASADFWPLLDIRSGIPTVFAETEDAFVPQMANMQLVNGVSFTKGCYTGQEVVARMQYLGKLKRRMYRAHLDVAEPPRPGQALFSAGSTSNQGAGRVVDARPDPGGGFELLAVAEIGSAEDAALHLGNASGPRLDMRPLPYQLPNLAV
jgi:folate-binding protein YgfZ